MDTYLFDTNIWLLTFNGDDFRAFDEIVVIAPAEVVATSS